MRHLARESCNYLRWCSDSGVLTELHAHPFSQNLLDRGSDAFPIGRCLSIVNYRFGNKSERSRLIGHFFDFTVLQFADVVDEK